MRLRSGNESATEQPNSDKIQNNQSVSRRNNANKVTESSKGNKMAQGVWSRSKSATMGGVLDHKKVLRRRWGLRRLLALVLGVVVVQLYTEDLLGIMGAVVADDQSIQQHRQLDQLRLTILIN